MVVFMYHKNNPNIPPILGKFYLVDAGYGARPGFLPPFRRVRYHLNEWGSNPVQYEKELFNLRHSSLRVSVERGFGSLKRRFKILDDSQPFFLISYSSRHCCSMLHYSQLGYKWWDRQIYHTRGWMDTKYSACLNIKWPSTRTCIHV